LGEDEDPNRVVIVTSHQHSTHWQVLEPSRRPRAPPLPRGRLPSRCGQADRLLAGGDTVQIGD